MKTKHLAETAALTTLIVAITSSLPARAADTQLLWGDTHLHTAYSTDAFLAGNRDADPDTAYRLAKGEPVIHPFNRTRVQIARPLDFLVVADHAEGLGVMGELNRQDPDLANLVLVGTPTDYHRNGALGKQYRRLSRNLKWLRRRTGLRAHDLNPAWLRSPGWANSLAFKLTNPVASVQGYWNLAKNLHDRDFVSAHATNGAFLNDMVAYPGGVIQDIIHYLWVDNVVARSQLPMPDGGGQLSRVQASILNITGAGDPIVTRDCSHAMDNLVGSRDKTYVTIPGGHMGILGGATAQQESWAMIADWLCQRD